MAEILAVGVTHYPPLSMFDEEMSLILRRTLEDQGIPSDKKNPSNWPSKMIEEWGNDFGKNAAARHRDSLIGEFKNIRKAIDDFNPELIIILGDDQYENFKEDVIPEFTVCAYDDLILQPWKQMDSSSMMKHRPNVWGEGEEKKYLIKSAKAEAKKIVSKLIEKKFDMAYAYKPLHHPTFGHAFVNTVLYLDYERKGWNYKTLALPINCYGSKVIAARGGMSKFGEKIDLDPPGPQPERCMQLGAALFEILDSSPWRVVVIASSSWSHAFLCDKTYRLYPDHSKDEALYDALVHSNYDYWRMLTTESLEDSGQQELLNWCVLLGGCEFLGKKIAYSNFIKTHIFNSNKVFAIYR
jgi:hypothetical protein